MQTIRRTGTILFLFILTMSGCLALEPPGSGGGNERKISGTYVSESGKALIFFNEGENDGKYQFYLDSKGISTEPANWISTYKVVENTITFYKEGSNEEFEEKGTLKENDTVIEWQEHPGQLFRLQGK